MRLTPADVHNVAFSKPPIGKRGYNEDEVDQFLLPGLADAAVRLQELDQGQGPLVRGERHGLGARVGVHQEEVDRVGTDVQDA